MNKIILLGIIFFCKDIFGKVLVFTFAHNRPDFIQTQHLTLKKFLTDDYEFVVFNDASNEYNEQSINNMCCDYGIRCIRVPQEIHTYSYLPHEPEEDLSHPTVRNVTVVQYSLDTLGFAHNDILVLFDSDLFLIKPFSFRQFLNGYDLGGMRLSNGYTEYLWHGLAILDMSRLPNKETLTFNCGKVNNIPIDAGGHSYYYIKNHPELKIRWTDNYHYSGHLYCEKCISMNSSIHKYAICNHNTQNLRNRGFNKYDIQLLQTAHNIEIYHNLTFVHYRAGTNWDYRSEAYHKQKTKAFQHYMTNILK